MAGQEIATTAGSSLSHRDLRARSTTARAGQSAPAVSVSSAFVSGGKSYLISLSRRTRKSQLLASTVPTQLNISMNPVGGEAYDSVTVTIQPR